MDPIVDYVALGEPGTNNDGDYVHFSTYNREMAAKSAMDKMAARLSEIELAA